MIFLKRVLHILHAIYLLVLHIIQVVYSFFQIHKTKVKPYKFKIKPRQQQRATTAQPRARNVRGARMGRKGGAFGAYLLRALFRTLSRRSRRFYKISASVCLLAFVGVGVVFFSGLFRIEEISITTASEQSDVIVSEYINRAQKNKELSQNALFFSLHDIRANILRQHPTIADIRVVKSLPSSITLQVTDRVRAGIWCADTTPEPKPIPIPNTDQETDDATQENADDSEDAEQEQEVAPPQPVFREAEPEQKPLQCFYYGRDGVIFQIAPQTSQGFLIREVRDKRYKQVHSSVKTTSVEKKEQKEQEKKDKVVYLGDQVLLKQDMEQIDLLYVALELGVEAPSYIAFVDEFEMRVGFRQGWEAYFSRQDPIVQQVENLAAALDEHIKTNKRFLDYIDVRYGNKIFYKYNSL